MRVWRRLHVFAQVLNVLSVIGDVVPVVEHPPWPSSNFTASNTSDTPSVDESSTTNEDGITGNFKPSNITEKSIAVPTIPYHVLDDLSTPKPEVTSRTQTLVETSTADTRINKKAQHSMLFAARSLDLIEMDLDNVIDTSGDSTIHKKKHPNFLITEKAEPTQCESDPKFHSVDYVGNSTTTTINTLEEDEVSDVAVEELTILDSTTKTLTISWKRPNVLENVQYYEVQWHYKEELVGTCLISHEATNYIVVIKSLDACTGYRATVLPVLESAKGAVKSIHGTTKLEVNENSVKLEIAAVGTDWIKIRWTVLPCTDCVFDYKIRVNEGLEFFEERMNTTTYTKTDLDSGVLYTFELTIMGNNYEYRSINVTGKTAVPKPRIKECDIHLSPSSMNYLEGSSPAILQNLDLTSPNSNITVEDLEVKSTGFTTLKVSWKQPNGTLKASYYIIEWFKSDNSSDITKCRVSNETFDYVIKSLVPCTTYSVKVLPHFETEEGTRRVVTGTTGLNVTADSLNLKIADKGPDWLKISWNMPSTDCVSHYVVDFPDVENVTEILNQTTYYEKKNLSPCLAYKIHLSVWGSAGCYGTLNVTGTTDYLAPDKPSPATTKSGSYSLFVSWPKPKGHTCVMYYRVVWSRKGISANRSTTNTFLQLTRLDPCAIYEIIVTAIDVTNNASLPEIIQSEITDPAVTDPPLKILDPSVTEKEISINWLIPTNETNNCLPIKLIVECWWTKTLGYGYISKNGSSEYNLTKSSINETIDTKVEEVSPFTKYECRSYTSNLGGPSGKSDPVIATTQEAAPSAPTLLPEPASNVTNTSITLQWKKPDYLPGILQNITILVIWEERWTHRAPWCNETNGKKNITNIDGTSTSYIYSAMPFLSYNIKILAATAAGWGPISSTQVFVTKPGAPEKVTDLNYKLQENSEDPNILESTLTWLVPCLINGKAIEFFHVLGKGNRHGFEEHTFTQIVHYGTDHCVNDSCSLLMEQLREEHTYAIEVAAKVSDYNYLGKRSEVIIDYPAGIPPQPKENYTSIISIDPYKARRTTTTATVLLPVFPDTNGEIKCYAIIVSKIGYNNENFGRLYENAWPPIATWIESSVQDFQIPYQATKFCSDSLQSYIADYGRFKAVKFVLGEDSVSCPEISSNKEERSYCNGPLKSDTVYHVRMRAFTAGGYRDSIVFTVKTNAELQLALVIGTIFGILFFGILITMMLLVRKCSLQAVLRRFLHSDMPGSPVPAPFTRRKFITHCQQLADNPGKLSNEYQLLQTLSVDLQMPTNAACLQANRKKNRYTDILPYDFSRVKLEVIDNDPNTDYINASFIKGFTGEEDYIACQGPKEETTYDFWRMIDQYDVKLIVMLTQLVEKNKEKCHQYFPTIREAFTYEKMAIKCSMELDYRTYTQRTLVLQKENAKRNIIHLHFKDWPDHDVPEDFDPMVNFCQIMRRHMEASRGLVVIHCSAGIGRTGTLIAIDILLQHIKDNRKLDVFGTVYRLRHHRINMVQRESQYAYIYNCIRQVLKNPYFSKTYKPPSVDPICDNNSHKKKETSESTTDLVSSLETLKKSSFSTSVESAEAIYQNPSKLLPFSGLRCAKSTGAIDTRPYQQKIGRYNTHDHPISDIAKDDLINSSEFSLEITESTGSTSSLYENMQPLSRSKSAQAFERDEDPCVTEKLLDTSL